MANEQLNQISQRWQKEVESKATEAQNLYKNFQSEMVFMTDEQKTKKEAEIVAKEKEATELAYKTPLNGQPPLRLAANRCQQRSTR